MSTCPALRGGDQRVESQLFDFQLHPHVVGDGLGDFDVHAHQLILTVFHDVELIGANSAFMPTISFPLF